MGKETMKHSRVLIAVFSLLALAGAASPRHIYRNTAYGIVLPIPLGTLACMAPVYVGNGIDHGINILLGTKDGSLCSKSSGKRYMGIFAGYNASYETKTLHALLMSDCEAYGKSACSPAPADLHLRGMKVEAGRIDHSDASIEIILVTQAGKPNPDFDRSVPSINYELNLVTDSQHLQNDLKAFRELLSTIKIAPTGR